MSACINAYESRARSHITHSALSGITQHILTVMMTVQKSECEHACVHINTPVIMFVL